MNIMPWLLVIVAAASTAFAKLEPTKELGVLNALVTDYDSKVYKNEKIVFVGQKTGKTVEGITDANGKFSIHIPKGDVYDIQYQSLSGPYKCGEVKVSLGATFANMNIQFENNNFELRNVLFDTGKATLKPESNKALDALVNGLKMNNDTLKIEIAGHTDNVGGEQYNLELSQARAASVRQYLLDHGIAAEHVSAKGYGFSVPVTDNDTESGRAQNRRTEVHILNLKR